MRRGRRHDPNATVVGGKAPTGAVATADASVRPDDGATASGRRADAEPPASSGDGRLHDAGGPNALEPVHRTQIRRDIEGLRAVAVVLVVLYHAKLAGVTGGYVGVDIFFVISGFLITRQLLGELRRRGRISLPRFYARRVKRLLPASAVVVVATLAGSLLWLSPLRLGNIVRDVIATSFYAVNYRLAIEGTDYLQSSAPPSPLQHYWSLAVEEQYYLIWPVLLLLVALSWSRHRRTVAATPSRSGNPKSGYGQPPRWHVAAVLGVLFAASLWLSIWLTHRSAPWAYFSLPSRAWELALGALVAVYADTCARLDRRIATVLSWAGLALVIVSARLLTDATPFPGSAALLPVGGAALVIAAGCSGPRLGAELFLGVGPMQLGGRLSYSWYLWHWPLLVLAPAAAGHPLHTQSAIAVIVASFCLAWLTFHLVENPVRRKEVLARLPRRGLALGGGLSAGTAVIALAVVFIVPAAAGVGPRAFVPSPSASGFAQAAERAIVAGAETRAAPSNLTPALESVAGDRPADPGCHLGFFQTTSGPCVYGDTSGGITAVLFGDSHAEQWFPALEQAALSKHWKLVLLTKSACPAVNVRVYSQVLKREYTECATWRANELRRLRQLRPQVVLLASEVSTSNVAQSGGQGFEDRWLAGTASIVKQLRADGASVVWVSDTPTPKENAPDCVAGHLRDVRPCMNSASASQPDATRRSASARAAAEAGATVVDPTPWICPGTSCPVIVGNLLVYRDNSHLTTAYATWLAPLLAAKLPAA